MNHHLTTPDEEPPDEYWMVAVQERAKESERPGMTVEFKKPKECAMALKMLAANHSVIKISRETGLSTHTVQNLKWRHKETLESRRKELARTYGIAAEATVALAFKKVEMLEDDDALLAQTSLKDIALSGAILTDKAVLLSGMATTVIEHRSGPSIEDAQAAIMAARQKIADRAKAEAIDV